MVILAYTRLNGRVVQKVNTLISVTQIKEMFAYCIGRTRCCLTVDHFISPHTKDGAGVYCFQVVDDSVMPSFRP